MRPGTVVQIVAPGVVTFADVVAGTRYVVVLQTDGLRSTYGMLQTALVTRGDVVVAGEAVGNSGPQFYFGLRDATNDPVDPTPLLGVRVGRARLLPSGGGSGRRAPPPRLACTAAASDDLTV